MSVLTDSTPESAAPAGDFDLLTPVEYIAPRANLLPPEIAERAALRKLQALLAAAVVACGGIVGAVYVTTVSDRGPGQGRARAGAERAAGACQLRKPHWLRRRRRTSRCSPPSSRSWRP